MQQILKGKRLGQPWRLKPLQHQCHLHRIVQNLGQFLRFYNQTFNIFMGVGSNGKSLLMKIMKNVMNGEDYTEKRKILLNFDINIMPRIYV